MRLKAVISVRAGVIPGEMLEEYFKQWTYNTEQYEEDNQTPHDQPTIYSKMLDEAHEYAKGLANPAYLNWVRVDWMWV